MMMKMVHISCELTPAHLLYGSRISMTPSGQHFDVTSSSRVLMKQAKHHLRLLDYFNKQ